MPNFGYHFARARGRFVQSLYELVLPQIVERRIRCAGEIPIDVFSYSGQKRLAEQVVSIRSFLKNAGRPNRFIVVSDGTHTSSGIELLRRIDQCVSVEEVPPPVSGVPAQVDSYLRAHPTGKQLALVMSLPRDRPALYVDSDVLFFAAAHEIRQYLEAQSAPAFYLQDCGFAGDDRLLTSDHEKAAPVNTGVLLIVRPLDWSLSISRFLELHGEPNFFTNQTMTHLTMHANGARQFDPAKYILRLDDQFIYSDLHAGRNVVLRHYVDPVRHKFWTSLAR
jgi:hypothetical protein